MGEIMKHYTLIILATVLISGCVTSSKKSVKADKIDDPRECAQNLTYNGSFFAGRTYKTKALVKNISKKTAMKRAARYTTIEGWSINNTDNELGIISASQTVSYGRGKTAPLNISIEPIKKDVKVSMTYSTSGGVTSPLESIRNHFCATIEAIEGK